MIRLRPIRTDDIAEIKNWPVYVDGFEQMDYALRDNGWIDEFWNRPNTWIYIAEVNEQIIGFSLLSMTTDREAEFRIAVHPRWTGKGLGKQVALAALNTGFRQLNLKKIHLIVRKNRPAAKLYESIGFIKSGESIHTIQGKRIVFFDMTIPIEKFNNLSRGENE